MVMSVNLLAKVLYLLFVELGVGIGAGIPSLLESVGLTNENVLLGAAVLVAVALRAVFAVICGNIAEDKNRKASGWFYGGFFLGLIGVAVIFCLPDKQK